MKTFSFIVSFIIAIGTFNSCSDDNSEDLDKEIEIVDPNMKEEQLSTLLQGRWHYYSGDIYIGLVGDMDSEINDHILDFNVSKNYTEIYTIESGDVYLRGNWNIKNNELILNDWDGNAISPIKVTEVSTNEIAISYSDNRFAVYRRVGTEYLNIEREILGYWNEYTTGLATPFYEFKSDGTVRYRSYAFNHESPVPGECYYEWEFDNGIISLTTLPVRYQTKNYVLKCCNSKYLIFGSIRLKRKK